MRGYEESREGSLEAIVKAPAFLTAAHELKSPLSLIRQLALYADSDSASPEDISRTLEQIKLTSERALRLTTNLTKTARLSDSLFGLEPVDSGVICHQVVEEIQPLYKARGSDVVLAGRMSPVLCVANRELLKRVLLNFADNALNYGETKEPVRLSVVLHSDNHLVRFGVRDFGPAIPAKLWLALKRRIDEGLVQPVSGRPDSSGLGMLIAKRFAEMMDAQIGVIRHRNGATFYLDVKASNQMALL